jgi:hypothetical protein
LDGLPGGPKRAYRRCGLDICFRLCVLFLLAASPATRAGEVLLSVGVGPQPGGDQTNRSASVDFRFFTYERSARQHISVGVVYTRLETDTVVNDRFNAVSIYPEFSYYPAAEGRIRETVPDRVEPYFFMRFLGPSYISENSFGDRQQDRHFSFLAQIGVGMLVEFGDERLADFRLSWKHFSNANWFSANDGIDVPFVVSWGLRF